ncbi:hypothetical protein CNY89_00135 [Amaricoccus sp. HAR-UPW-R2A-40]|nr:hypothetical protein CNY89_00135 [Amaricoccus sp. HAR-UPW-R2A-40]
MSDKINWGGAAFPCEGGEGSGLYPDPGMSMRDWFAGNAPVTAENVTYAMGSTIWDLSSESGRAAFFAVMALLRYEYADAMLAERQKGVAV